VSHTPAVGMGETWFDSWRTPVSVLIERSHKIAAYECFRESVFAFQANSHFCQQALKRLEILRTESMDSDDGALLSCSAFGLSCLSGEVRTACMPPIVLSVYSTVEIIEPVGRTIAIKLSSAFVCCQSKARQLCPTWQFAGTLTAIVRFEAIPICRRELRQKRPSAPRPSWDSLGGNP